MTKPTMGLVEEYGEALLMAQGCDSYGQFKAAMQKRADADALLSEIRQRLEAMERREAELESDLMEAAKCAFQYAAKVGELERDAARYRWLRYNASFTIHSFLFGEPSMAHHADSDFDAAIDQQLES